jgi:hypothetical protein
MHKEEGEEENDESTTDTYITYTDTIVPTSLVRLFRNAAWRIDEPYLQEFPHRSL